MAQKSCDIIKSEGLSELWDHFHLSGPVVSDIYENITKNSCRLTYL